MTPKEKANIIVKKYLYCSKIDGLGYTLPAAKEGAIILVEEMLTIYGSPLHEDYWKAVKEEILNINSSADGNKDIVSNVKLEKEVGKPKENAPSCGLDYYEIRRGACQFGDVYHGNIVCMNPNCKETALILDN